MTSHVAPDRAQIPDEVINNAWGTTKDFFDLDEQTKVRQIATATMPWGGGWSEAA
jgi:hypothetical protein